MYYCKFCAHKISALKTHIDHQKHHRNISKFLYCGYKTCKRIFKTYAFLSTHLHQKHDLRFKKEGNPLSISCDKRGKFVCTVDICRKEFDNMYQLIKHLKFHISNQQEIVCPYQKCRKKYTVLSSFTGHLTRSHKKHVDQKVINTGSNFEISTENSGSQQMLNEEPLEIEIQQDILLPQEHAKIEFNSNIEADLFLENIAQFYLKLGSQFLIPVSTIQYIVSEINNMHNDNQVITQHKLKEQLLACNITPNKIDQILTDSFNSSPFIETNKTLETDFKRKSFYK